MDGKSSTIVCCESVSAAAGLAAIGALGKYQLTPRMLILVGCAKLVAIGVTVLAGYRGGFIFPFMVAGVAIGCGFARAGVSRGRSR